MSNRTLVSRRAFKPSPRHLDYSRDSIAQLSPERLPSSTFGDQRRNGVDIGEAGRRRRAGALGSGVTAHPASLLNVTFHATPAVAFVLPHSTTVARTDRIHHRNDGRHAQPPPRLRRLACSDSTSRALSPQAHRTRLDRKSHLSHQTLHLSDHFPTSNTHPHPCTPSKNRANHRRLVPHPLQPHPPLARHLPPPRNLGHRLRPAPPLQHARRLPAQPDLETLRALRHRRPRLRLQSVQCRHRLDAGAGESERGGDGGVCRVFVAGVYVRGA